MKFCKVSAEYNADEDIKLDEEDEEESVEEVGSVKVRNVILCDNGKGDEIDANNVVVERY